MITTRKVTSLAEVRAHARRARKVGKCIQCRRPWYDGMCSCGQWGPEEERIVKLVAPILEEKDRKDRERFAKQQAERIKQIDAKLKPVKELQGLWKSDE